MVYPPGLRGTCSGLPTGFEGGGHFILCSSVNNKILSPKRFLITRRNYWNEAYFYYSCVFVFYGFQITRVQGAIRSRSIECVYSMQLRVKELYLLAELDM